jgi:four helix bundle protein
MHPFEKLTVWRLAHEVAVELYATSAPWDDRDLRTQLRRCASSVAANLAEGAGFDSPGQFARYLAFALASSSELRSHLLYARDVGLLDPATHERFDATTQSVRRMLIALRRRVMGFPRTRKAEGHPSDP